MKQQYQNLIEKVYDEFNARDIDTVLLAGGLQPLVRNRFIFRVI
jgi:hypothetical protein